MKLLFKQRLFSWLDSYDIYNENGETVYTVQGKISFGHRLAISDQGQNEIGEIVQRVFSFLPCYEAYLGQTLVGVIKKEFTLFNQRYTLEGFNWEVEGDFFSWEYNITENGRVVATVSKQLFNFTDTYVIDIFDSNDALKALFAVLAIDAANCDNN